MRAAATVRSCAIWQRLVQYAHKAITRVPGLCLPAVCICPRTCLIAWLGTQCGTCESFHFQPIGEMTASRAAKSSKCVAAHGPAVGPVCAECGGSFRVGGPVWTDSLHNTAFVDDMIGMVMATRDAGLSAHPEVLPPTDGGSNTQDTVHKSRARLLDILRACRSEVHPVCFKCFCCWPVDPVVRPQEVPCVLSCVCLLM